MAHFTSVALGQLFPAFSSRVQSWLGRRTYMKLAHYLARGMSVEVWDVPRLPIASAVQLVIVCEEHTAV